jgi:hypothetical protein
LNVCSIDLQCRDWKIHVPTFGPADQQTEERAIRTAKGLTDKHAGVIAWSREAHPDVGEYGPPTTLFASGTVPDMNNVGGYSRSHGCGFAKIPRLESSSP